MATVHRRTPVAGAAKQVASSGVSGAEALRRMKLEEQRIAARKEAAKLNRDMPFRYKIPPDGESYEVIVVDTGENIWCRQEHNLKDRRTGHWTVFTQCIAENATCPVCKASPDRQSYYGMFLTVIDLRSYEKDGRTIPWTKKLFVVKTGQQKKFMRLLSDHGTWRGMVLRCTRDGDMEPQIGNDIEFVEFVSEEDLATYHRVERFQTRDGQTKTREIIGNEPFDYDALFPAQTEQQLRAIVGGQPEPGSREESDGAVGRRSRGGSGDGWDDEPPAPGARRMNTRTAARRAPEPEPEEEVEGVEGDEQDEAPPPARTARPATRAAAPAARPAAQPVRRVTRAAPEPEPEEEAEVIDPDDNPEAGVEPVVRGPRSQVAHHTSRAAPASRPATTSRRAAQPDPEEEPEPEPEDEPAPSRASGQSLAEKRAALRRGR